MSHIKFDWSTRLSLPVDVEMKAEPSGMVVGYASVFDITDRQNEVVRKGAFRRTLAEHRAEGTMPACLWAHNPEAVVGAWTLMDEDAKGLRVSGRLNLKTARGQEAYEHVRGGDASGLSIGFICPDGGRKYAGAGQFEIIDLDLVEVSIVATPSNRRARISGVKSVNSKAELVDLLHDAGFAKTAAARVAASGWAGLNGDDIEAKATRLLTDVDRALAQLKGN